MQGETRKFTVFNTSQNSSSLISCSWSSRYMVARNITFLSVSEIRQNGSLNLVSISQTYALKIESTVP